MATMVGKEKDLVKLIKDLIELDYDAIDAYEAAIDRVKTAAFKVQLTSFCDDHRRHVTDLTTCLVDMNEQAPVKGDIKRVLTKGMVVIGGLIGDRAILKAMKTNEDDTNTAYERAVGRSDVPPHIRPIFSRNLGDERRHRAWIEAQIASMKEEARTERTSSESLP